MVNEEREIKEIKPSSRLAFKFAWRISLVIAGVVVLLAIVMSITLTKRITEMLDTRGTDIVSLEAAHSLEYWKQLRATGQNPLKKLADEKEDVVDILVTEVGEEKSDKLLVAARPAGSYVVNFDEKLISHPEDKQDIRIANGRFQKGGEGLVDARLFWKTIPAENGQQGTVFLILSAARLEEQKWSFLSTLILVGLVAIAVGIGFSYLLAALVTRPVRNLATDMGIVSRGSMDHKTRVHGSDEIGMLGRAFNRMTISLKEAQEREVERLALQRELGIAEQIQSYLLPRELPSLPRYDLCPYYKPARQVGGDYYDFIPVDGHHLGLVVADVSGKGVPGSLVMMMIRSVIRHESRGTPSAGETLRRVNRQVAADIKRGMFVTAVYMVLDVQAGALTVASAGHNPLVYWNSLERKCRLVKPGGMAVGLDKGPIFDKELVEVRLTLAPSDRVVAYTDGVIEAMNERGEEFGEERFRAVCERLAELPSRDFVENVMEEIRRHQGSAEQHDDITISTFRYLG